LANFLELREKKKELTLKEVSAATKISATVINAIETADQSKLPAKPYIRGFIQSYAKHLGMDVEEIMRLFSDAMGSTLPNDQHGNLDNQPTAESLDIINEKWSLIRKTGIIISVLSFLLIIFFLLQFLDKYEEENISAEIQKKQVLVKSTENSLIFTVVNKVNRSPIINFNFYFSFGFDC